jgi:ABC-2 type transport system ATP-binding protein
MIFADQLTKSFGDFLAVNHVSLSVEQGEVLALLGKNGAGKTTTVRMLTSILRPSSGSARVAGFDVVTQAEQVRASVGVLTEQHGLYGRMNAAEYLDFFGSLYGLSRLAARQHYQPWLERFGLAQEGKKRLGEYSKGMRQKLALVRALLHGPPVLLLDEPTSAMDPESARTVRDAIQQLKGQGRTLLLCTHNLAEGEALADRVAILEAGRILIDDTLEGVKRRLLGPAVYVARLTGRLNGWQEMLPEGVILNESGDDWMSFRVDQPERANPELLRRLLASQLDVISFEEAPRSLEEAFLEAVKRAEGGAEHV